MADKSCKAFITVLLLEQERVDKEEKVKGTEIQSERIKRK